MADKIYVVTLKERGDLEGFYFDMESDGYKIHLKRPISRNTQYYMTDEQADTIRDDSRVLACEQRPEDIGITPVPYGREVVNNTAYGFAGDFRKSTPYAQDNRQWGHLHVAGDDAQRKKGSWGSGEVTDSISVFNNGKHVDVVIVDDPVSFDCAEWWSAEKNVTRFKQYDWYTELNTYVGSIDDDGQSLPSGSYPNYIDNNANQTYHGNHVAGTVAGQWYGWAPEADIYSLQVLSNNSGQGTPVPVLLCFDYLRAFHKNKPINPETGKRNPTVTNHSWGYGVDLRSQFDEGFALSDYASVVYRGTTYTSLNPNPSGWTLAGLEADFGLSQWKRYFNYHYTAINADVEDAIEDGVVIIGAAGNSDFYMSDSEPTDPSYVDWNNRVTISGASTYYFMRGSSPCNAKGVINVGAIDTASDFRRADFSNFGPRVDVWAPGVSIVSSFNSYGTADGKYGPPNYFWAISGTSMASPQVCGVAACLATGKERFTNSDVLGYIQLYGKKGDMTFDVAGGNFADATCRGSNGGLYFDSDVIELRVDNPRPESGYLAGWYKDTLKGHRRDTELPKLGSIQVYPRQNILYRIPADGPETHMLNVIASSGKYVLDGTDRNGTISSQQNPTINLKKGDTLQLGMSAAGHPLWIQISQATGQPAAGNIPAGITNNGIADGGNITWDTSQAIAGTYYYNCEFHPSMTGTIFVV